MYEIDTASASCLCASLQVCGLQLTLKTFSRASSSDGGSKEIYCRTHAPKMSATSVGGDAVGIRAALDAQKQASDKVLSMISLGDYDHFVGSFMASRDSVC